MIAGGGTCLLAKEAVGVAASFFARGKSLGIEKSLTFRPR
jgi:hypothetical protein